MGNLPDKETREMGDISQEEIKDIIAEEEIAMLEDNELEQSKKNKKLKNKVNNRNVVIIILVIIIIILLLRSCSSESSNTSLTRLPDLETAEYIEPDEVPKTEHIEGTTAIPVISDFTINKSYPYATLFNPESNEGFSYLQYRFTNSDTGEVIYESKLVQPGKKFSVAFGDMLEVGTYNVSIDIYSFDYNNPSIQKNGGHSEIVVTVTK